MKKQLPIRRLPAILVLAVMLLAGISCEKSRDIQTFDDVFDLSGVEALNGKVMSARSADDLVKIFENTQLSVPSSLSKITLTELAEHFSRNLELTPHEVDMLLKNDSRTYIEVINRFGSMPAVVGELGAKSFESLKAGPMGEFTLKVKEEPQNFYTNDYYSAVLAMQSFISNSVVAPMKAVAAAANENASSGKDGKTIPPGLDKDPAPGAVILFYKLIASNKIFDIWWTYWSDGSRTKHKGAAGSFPG